MNKFTQNKKSLLIWLSIAVILVFLCLLVYWPLSSRIKTKDAQWQSLKIKLGVFASGKSLSDRAMLSKKLTSPKDVPAVLEQAAKDGAGLGLTFKSVSQKAIINTDANYSVLPIEMEIEGNFEQLGRFFGTLENSKVALFVVREFTLTRDELILPKIRAEVSLNLYLSK